MPVTADILLETLCYHAQQAAEKSIKAVLLSHSVAVPKTHNLKVLLELLPTTCPVPEVVGQAAALTD